MVDVLFGELTLEEGLDHVLADGIATEALQVVLQDGLVVRPHKFVEGIFVLDILLDTSLEACLLHDLSSLVLGQTALQLLVGKASLLVHLFLRGSLEE